ncbi:hypothetical protein [Pseudomonas gingeri]|uniref:hypothetical protein n=1 Tax=Pseudomonas gingeri TaxID=117681 RepID=UPI001C433E1C|nr:hypothetical protein [Pseudomonas gingeri]
MQASDTAISVMIGIAGSHATFQQTIGTAFGDTAFQQAIGAIFRQLLLVDVAEFDGRDIGRSDIGQAEAAGQCQGEGPGKRSGT